MRPARPTSRSPSTSRRRGGDIAVAFASAQEWVGHLSKARRLGTLEAEFERLRRIPLLVAATVDRLVHHAEVIVLQGDSDRLKDRGHEVVVLEPH